MEAFGKTIVAILLWIALKICSRLAIINEEIDVATFNYKKTFDSLPQQGPT